MPQPVPPPMMKERNRILRELVGQKKLEFMQSFVGQTVAAITLQRI